ncbi:MAG: WbqC family protein, partial [Tannerellaceae bacterium]|nr:WbqC family protein [Tannerellaceae bacterium]
MKLAIFQPYFFPYTGYFQLIRSVDRFILYDHVNYIKRGWITRNRISAPGGKEIY